MVSIAKSHGFGVAAQKSVSKLKAASGELRKSNCSRNIVSVGLTQVWLGSDIAAGRPAAGGSASDVFS